MPYEAKNFEELIGIDGFSEKLLKDHFTLYQDFSAGRLFNVWVNEHDVGHFAGAIPLIVMDVFEHSYMTDYGINRKSYIEKFMANLDWTVIEQRLVMK